MRPRAYRGGAGHYEEYPMRSGAYHVGAIESHCGHTQPSDMGIGCFGQADDLHEVGGPCGAVFGGRNVYACLSMYE